MRFVRPVLVAAVVPLLLLAACNRFNQKSQEGESASSQAVPTPPEPPKLSVADKPLACDWPVAPDATADSLLKQYGDDAVVGPLEGPNATVIKGVILFRRDSKQRIEVTFWDKKMQHVATVRLGQEATAWQGPQGLHYGSSLGEVMGANGSLGLGNYNWDDGGYFADLGEGPLSKLSGGCRLSLRLRPQSDKRDDVPYTSMDEDEIDGNDERLPPLGLTVARMGIAWQKPKGSAPKANDEG